MYESYWKFECRPFHLATDSRFYYPSEAHQGALLKLRYAIEGGRGAALLAGASGLGKTLLVRMLAKQLPDQFLAPIHVDYPLMPPEQLLSFLAGEFDGGQKHTTIDESLQRIRRALLEYAKAGRQAVVVFDEAHLLSPTESLECVRLLMNLDTIVSDEAGPALAIILVGQPAILPILNRLPSLDDRMALKCVLRPFSLDDTVSYVSHQLNAAGASQAIFAADALERIHDLSGGVPRRINRLCDLALLTGFAEELPTIAAEQVESVRGELVSVVSES